MNPRKTIEHAFRAALAASEPEAAVRRSLLNQDNSGPVWLISIGKAASPMLAGAISALGDAVQGGFLITKDEHIDRSFDERMVLREASHPVLDGRTLSATGELLAWIQQIPLDVRVIVLLSGGGSALLESPVPGVTLAEFQQMTRELLNGGADIYQLNCVRSLVSQVKGGRLREAIPARVVETIAVSDVLGNDTSIIASGPTVRMQRTSGDALTVIDELDVRSRMPASVLAVIQAGNPPASGQHPDDRFTIIADNTLAIEAATGDLRSLGLNVDVRDQITQGEAREVARKWVDSLVTIADDVDGVISGGELTVTVTGHGVGGRNTEFALSAAVALRERGLEQWTIASLATDGQDALTGFAGAIVDSTSTAALVAKGIDPQSALDANDSASALDAIGAMVYTGPTGTNVNDLYVGLRTRTV